MYNITCIGNKRMKQSCNTTLMLRKGAWTAEEDMLLKNCIEKFGEGKWHLVPLRAGLNRCRKSCRLRWLNYLRPDIKRGDFNEDEVDLMHRLHRLLGNRWSLIAGRIPGRTANDVKNYWNTHVKPHSKQQKEELKNDEPSEHTRVTIIKPQPHTISKTLNLHQHIITHDTRNLITPSHNGTDNTYNISPGIVASPTVSNDMIKEYMDQLFYDDVKEINHEFGWSFNGIDVVEQGDGLNSLFDFSTDDVFMWDLDSN